MLLPDLAGSFSAEVPVCWKSLGVVISLMLAAMPDKSSVEVGLGKVLAIVGQTLNDLVDLTAPLHILDPIRDVGLNTKPCTTLTPANNILSHQIKKQSTCI